jgi:magnesium transporter
MSVEYYIKKDEKTGIKKLDRFRKGCLIHVNSPDKDFLTQFSKDHALDSEEVICVLDRYELPRADYYDNRFYIFLKTISAENKNELETFLIILKDQSIILISKSVPDFLLSIITGKEKKFQTAKKLECILDLFLKNSNEFEKETLKIVRSVNTKKELITKLTEKDIDELVQKENVLNGFVSSYEYMLHVYQRIIKNKRFDEEEKEFIEDLMIEAEQGLNICKSSIKTISNIRNNFVILLSNRLNKIITLLTVFTIFINTPAMLTGIYGMNVNLPMAQSPFAFYYIIIMIIAFWGILFLFLKKNIL